MQTTFKNLSDFKSVMANDSELQDAFKTDPAEAAKTIKESPLDTDTWIYRIVVSSMGTAIILIILGVLILIGAGKFTDDKSIPTILTAVGSSAIGALSGLLAPSPKK